MLGTNSTTIQLNNKGHMCGEEVLVVVVRVLGLKLMFRAVLC